MAFKIESVYSWREPVYDIFDFKGVVKNFS